MTRPGPITRRGLLQVGGVATLAACLSSAATSANAVASGGAAAPAHLRRATYAALDAPRGLTAAGPAGPVALALDGVGDVIGARSHSGLRDSDDAFALRLSGPAGGAALAQGTHAFSHPRLGDFELFLVPVDLPAAGQQYEVVVDRSIA